MKENSVIAFILGAVLVMAIVVIRKLTKPKFICATNDDEEGWLTEDDFEDWDEDVAKDFDDD